MPVYKIETVYKRKYVLSIRADSLDEARALSVDYEDYPNDEWMYSQELVKILDDSEEADND